MTDYLVLKGGKFHVRLDVPADVRDFFGGRRVLSKSLATGSRTDAHVLKLPWLAKWKRDIEQARKGAMPDFREEVVHLVERFQKPIEEENNRPFNWHNPPPVEESAFWQRGKAVNEVIKKHKLSEPLKREAIDILSGYSDYSPKTPFFKSRLDAYHKYEHDLRGVALNTVDRHVKRIKLFDAFLKEKEADLDYDSVAMFLASLDLEAKTKKQYLFSLNSFYNFAAKKEKGFRDKYPQNPFVNHELSEVKRGAIKEAARRAFSVKEIERLHKAALEEENQRLADLIEIGSYTGARIEEICQLRIKSIVEEDGIRCFHIREGKAKAAIRHVPIHPALEATIERLCSASDDGYLLKTSGGGKYGVKSKGLGDDFSDFKTRLGFDETTVFHSIRKSVVALLERADVKNLVIMSIVGHQIGGNLNITFDRYSEGPTPKAKREVLEKLAFSL